MSDNFSFKELYDVSLKPTYNMESGSFKLNAGETFTVFDRLQIANFKELFDNRTATGGRYNLTHIVWQTTKEIDLMFVQGVFSLMQFAVMTNSKLFQRAADDNLLISQREFLESDAQGQVTLKYLPANENIYVKSLNGQKVQFSIEDKVLTIPTPYTELIIDYVYKYENPYSTYIIGKKLFNGFFSLEGKTRVKDDIDGRVKTGIIYIPRLKLMSDLSITLGKNANPVSASFRGVAYPERNMKALEFHILSDDIDSDI